VLVKAFFFSVVPVTVGSIGDIRFGDYMPMSFCYIRLFFFWIPCIWHLWHTRNHVGRLEPDPIHSFLLTFTRVFFGSGGILLFLFFKPLRCYLVALCKDDGPGVVGECAVLADSTLHIAVYFVAFLAARVVASSVPSDFRERSELSITKVASWNMTSKQKSDVFFLSVVMRTRLFMFSNSTAETPYSMRLVMSACYVGGFAVFIVFLMEVRYTQKLHVVSFTKNGSTQQWATTQRMCRRQLAWDQKPLVTRISLVWEFAVCAVTASYTIVMIVW